MKPIAILSLPSQGSDWFTESLNSILEYKYHREYFQPLHNMEISGKLLEAGFGCELDGYQIKNTPKKGLTEFFVNDIKERNIQLVKEVWSSAKWKWFNEHFDTIYLIRRFDNTFPPTRMRVINWYHHLWYTNVRFESPMMSIPRRCLNGYNFGINQLNEGAKKNNTNIIEYEKLLDLDIDGMVKYLKNKRLPKEHFTEKSIIMFAEKIIDTRKISPDRSQLPWSNLWEQTINVYRSNTNGS